VFFNNFNNLAIAGRLDKQSEGLLILSNDGKWIENLCNPKFEKEKEYDVILDKKPNEEFIKLFTSGVLIGKYITKTCQCKIIDDFSIRVILKEGKNRQIRKMCKTLGYSVLILKRTRIHHFKLGSLNEGEYIKANVSSTSS
jgi:23S rRNA pseudouridine2604 synthase